MKSGNSYTWALAIVFILLCVSIVLRVKADSTDYRSVDSHFYLKAAEHILTNKEIISSTAFPNKDETQESLFRVWPVGYPILIALMSLVIPNLIWASKAINLLFLGASFLLLYLRFKESALWASFAYFSYGLTEVYSYTWSEGPFLFFVLLMLLGIDCSSHRKRLVVLSLSLSALFLLRYAGLLFWIYLAFHAIFASWKKNDELAKSLWGSLALSGILIAFYLGMNYFHTGYFTGAQRVYADLESWQDYLFYLGRGILNSFAFTRPIWSFGTGDLLAFFLLLMQSVLLIFVLKDVDLKASPEVKVMMAAGLFYLTGIALIRIFSPFDKFDFRILSPFILLLHLSFFISVFKKDGVLNYRSKLVYVLISVSYLVNLPNRYLVSYWY